MKLYYCISTLPGMNFPSCAIIVAPDRRAALRHMERELHRQNLPVDRFNEPQLVEVPLDTPHAMILLDGDY